MSEADTAAAEESMPAAAPSRARSVQGSVVSARMEKTITVLVERQLQHPLYKKYIRRKTTYKVHDEENTSRVGDQVLIAQSRPLSKSKRWRLVEITEKSKMRDS